MIKNRDISSSPYVTTDRNNPFAEHQPQEAPKKTILQSLAPDLNTEVKANNIQGLGVDATKGNIRANINPNQMALNSIGQQCTKVKADISATIREAQGQVIEATKAVGADPAELFADTRMAPESGAELLIPAVGSKSSGLGSMAMKTSNSLLSMDDVVSDRRKINNEEAMAAIEQELRAMSSAPQEDSRAAFKVSMSADAAPDDKKTQGFNWNEFFDQGHELKDLMSIDPDKPQPGLVPEFAEVEQIERNVVEATAKNDYAKKNTNEVPAGIDERNLHAEDFKIDPQELKARIGTASDFLVSISGRPKGMDNKTTSLGVDVKELLDELKNPQPEPPAPRPERNMSMGMMAA